MTCPVMDSPHKVYVELTTRCNLPCHFLWHSYSCRILEDEASVAKHSFGNVSHKTLDDIWCEAAYSNFREEAGSYDYTYCWTCAQGPLPMES